MWSFLSSVVIFALLVIVVGLWQRAARKALRTSASNCAAEVGAAVELAQRRHIQRFGRASTDLNDSFQGLTSTK